MIFILAIVFLIDIKWWPWYEKNSQKEEFNSENFLENLKVIPWTIFQWPTNELYTQYGKFLDSTDKYLKLETYDFTNKFFKTRFQNLSNRWVPVQIILENLKEIPGIIFQWPTNELYTQYENFLNSTDKYLKLETYDFTNKFFKTRFQNLSNRWVPVQIILENNKYQQYQNTFRQLQEYFSWDENIELRSDEQMWTSYVHAKFTLNEDAFRVQTANLTKSSFESNREHFFYSNDSKFHDSLEKLVNADWAWDDLSTLNLHPNLVVCPRNCRDVIETLLENAKKSIVIQTQYIVDDEIMDILREKSSGVDMAIIVADTDDNYDLLSYFGPWIFRSLKKRYNHTKIILVDEKYLLLWSMNLSSNSLDKNREIWIILMDTGHIAKFEKWFKKDWADSI